jgi:hypothetical protein
MTCLAGGVEELRYTLPPGERDPALATPRSPATRRPLLPGVIAAETPCPRLTPGATTALAPGQTAYISDVIVRAHAWQNL